MQRYIARRVLHSIMAIMAMSVIVFALARVSGNPLDDLQLIADPEKNFAVIMKDGKIYKNTLR